MKILTLKSNRFIVFLLLPFGFISCQNISIEKKEIINNVLLINDSTDLLNTIVEFKGSVNFYWQQFIADTIVNNNISNISLLNSWNNQKNGALNHDALGYGSYVFQIHIPDSVKGESFILKPNHFIAYASEVYVDGQLAASNGSVGKSAEDPNYKPSRKTTVKPFIVTGNVLEVVVLVSNFHHFRGGIFNTLQFGLASNMITHKEKELTIDLLIIITLLIMFFYHFILYFVNRQDAVALFFSLTCLIFALDFSFQDTMTFFQFFPRASFRLYSTLQITSSYLIAPAFITFLYALFPNETSRKIRNGTVIISFILVLTAILYKPELNSIIAKPNYVYTFLLILYIFIPAIKAYRNKRIGAKLFFYSFLVFAFCAINDILFVLEIIYTASLVSAGLCVFVFLLSIMQGRRLALMNKQNKDLSIHLTELNVSLEEKVESRTLELNTSLIKQKELSQFKEDFTSMIVHDLKNPLNSILSHPSSEKIKQQARQMLVLVMNILDIQKFEDASIKIEPDSILVVKLINNAIEQIMLSAKDKNIHIENNIASDIVILADFDLIERVLINLLSNAVKYTPNNGKVTILVNNEGEEFLKVQVRDTGKGIPNDKQLIIFQKFEQVDAKKFGNTPSTGLGLTFCKLAVEAHGGKIGVESDGKSGSVFWFTLKRVIRSAKNENVIAIDVEELTVNFVNVKNEIDALKQLKFYEISKIRKVLAPLENSNNIEILNWRNAVLKAVVNGNESVYNKLIEG